MYLHLTKEEEPNDSPSEEIMEEQEPTIFDPKSFIESLFNSRQAEIEVLLHNNASYNQNITRYSPVVNNLCLVLIQVPKCFVPAQKSDCI